MLKRLLPLKPFLARYQKRYAIGFLCLVVAQAVGIVPPLVIKAGIDALSATVTRSQLLFYAGLLLAIAFIKAVFQFWQRWILKIGRAHV